MDSRIAAGEPLTVTIDEAKRISGLGITTLYALIGEGRLASTLIGRRRLVNYESLKQLLRAEAA